MPGYTLPSVSFVITVYNKAHYLERVLKALHRQSGDFAREYIFIDDGSTDDSLNQLRRLTKGWDDVTIIHQSNQGVTTACNAGIARAKHEFIRFVDADDAIFRNSTRTMLELLVSHNADAIMASHSYKAKNGYNGFYYAALPKKGVELHINPLAKSLQRDIKRSIFLVGNSRTALRTSLAKQVGGADTRTPHIQDMSLSLRVMNNCRFILYNSSVCFELNPSNDPKRLSRIPVLEQMGVTFSYFYFLRDHLLTPELQQLGYERLAQLSYRLLHNLQLSRWYEDIYRFIYGYLPFTHRFLGKPTAYYFINKVVRRFQHSDPALAHKLLTPMVEAFAASLRDT